MEDEVPIVDDEQIKSLKFLMNLLQKRNLVVMELPEFRSCAGVTLENLAEIMGFFVGTVIDVESKNELSRQEIYEKRGDFFGGFFRNFIFITPRESAVLRGILNAQIMKLEDSP